MTTKNPASASDAASHPDDPAKVLLNLLRNVDREVRSTLELGAEALRAVATFRSLAASLRVRPVATARVQAASRSSPVGS